MHEFWIQTIVFRFQKRDMERLCVALNLPETYTVTKGQVPPEWKHWWLCYEGYLIQIDGASLFHYLEGQSKNWVLSFQK